jgi:hypothetical protein
MGTELQHPPVQFSQLHVVQVQGPFSSEEEEVVAVLQHPPVQFSHVHVSQAQAFSESPVDSFTEQHDCFSMGTELQHPPVQFSQLHVVQVQGPFSSEEE